MNFVIVRFAYIRRILFIAVTVRNQTSYCYGVIKQNQAVFFTIATEFEHELDASVINRSLNFLVTVTYSNLK